MIFRLNDPETYDKRYEILVETPAGIQELGWIRFKDKGHYEATLKWIMDLYHGARFEIREVTKADIIKETRRLFGR